MEKLFKASIMLTIVFITLQLSSCNESDPALVPQPATVNSNDSFEEEAGKTFLLAGQNLTDQLEISLGEISIVPTIISSTQLSFVIPEDASSGRLTIKSGDEELIDKYFKILETGFKFQKEEIRNYRGYEFLNSRVGYYANSGELYGTVDGGGTWSLLREEPNLLPIHAVTEDEVWIEHEPWDLQKSIDGGSNWTHIDFPQNENLRDLSVDAENAFAVTDVIADKTAQLLHSVDGGNTWTELINQGNFEALRNYHISYQNASNLVLYNQYERKLIVTENLVNWSQIELPVSPRLSLDENSVFTLDKNNIWTLTYTGLASTKDAGKTWNEQEFELSDDSEVIGRLHFFNNEQGMAITSDGGILRTTDGGNSWQLTYLKGRFIEADFIDSEKVVVIGHSYGSGNIGDAVNLVRIEF